MIRQQHEATLRKLQVIEETYAMALGQLRADVRQLSLSVELLAREAKSIAGALGG